MTASHQLSVGSESALLRAPRPLECAGLSGAAGRVPATPFGRRITPARHPIGLLYLLSVGLVGAATVGLFFGSAFALLIHPKEQLLTAADTHDRDLAPAPLRFNGPSTDTEDGAPHRDLAAAPTSMAAEPTTTAPAQTATLSEPEPSSETASTSPSHPESGNRLRKLPRLPNSGSKKIPGRPSATAGRIPVVNQDPNHDPDQHAAANANRREYNQLQQLDP